MRCTPSGSHAHEIYAYEMHGKEGDHRYHHNHQPLCQNLGRRYDYNGRDYWSPYDLLGLFLSFMGPAPNSATKRNFYLPMTAVYGR
jgi:hypothetical protein